MADQSTFLPPVATPGRADSLDGRVRRAFGPLGRRLLGATGSPAVRLVAAIGSWLVVAEAITLAVGPAAGVFAHSIMLVLLLGLSLRLDPGPMQRLTLGVAILPLIRILSLAVPAAIVPIVYWYLEIGLAGMEGILLVMRRLDLSPADVGLRRTSIAEIATVGILGAILGLPAYLIGGRVDLGHGGGLVGLAIASAVVVVFIGFFEELLFRGLIQSAGTVLFSRGGVLLSIGATVLMYSASLNPRYIIFIALVATLFGLVARRSGSILAPVVGHSTLALMQLIVLPLLVP